MGYSSFKKITKSFKFEGEADKNEIPAYAQQYIKKEGVLAVYRTLRDFGIFTDNKVILFDNLKNRKHIYSIPYQSISMLSICFGEKTAEVTLFIDSGCEVNLRFVNMTPKDKLNLRILYTCIDKISSSQDMIAEDMNALIKKKKDSKK